MPQDPHKAPGDETEAGTKQTGQVACESCNGTGKLAGQPCPACEGTGLVTVIVGDA